MQKRGQIAIASAAAILALIALAALLPTENAPARTEPLQENPLTEPKIIILNKQSYPPEGGNWTVEFETTGKAGLEIEAVQGTLFGKDLQFSELKCGSRVLASNLANNKAVVKDYECSEKGSIISKVLSSGKHSLQFSFGKSTEYAYNAAGDPDINVNDPNGGETASSETYTIDFNVSDTTSGEELRAALYYSDSSGDFNYLIADLNLNNYFDYAGLTCDNNTWTSSTNCTYDWNVMQEGIPTKDGEMVLYLPLDVDGKDFSRLGNDGTLSNFVASEIGVAGIRNRAIECDGAAGNNRVTVTDNASIDVFDGDYTVGAWTKLSSADGKGQIIGQYGASYPRWGLRAYDTSCTGTACDAGPLVYARDATSGAQRICAATNIRDNAWHFVVVTRIGASNKIYVDGVDDTCVVDSIPANYNSAYDLTICEELAGNYEVDGVIDEAFIMDRGLSATEIRAWYDAIAVDGNTNYIDDGDYFIDANVWDSSSNDAQDSSDASFEIDLIPPPSVSPDVNVAYPEKGESFNRNLVSTLDINVTVQDSDTNTFDATIELRYSTSQTQDTGTLIIDDVNLATLNCDSNNLKTVQECKYTWDISSVSNGDYYILAEVGDGTNTDFNAGEATFTITGTETPDVNVAYPESGESFDKTVFSTIDINVTIQDSDTNTFDVNIDLNYHTSQTQGAGTVIINDVNLATLDCDSNNLETVQECKYRWDISSVSNGTYYILAETTDGSTFDFNAGESSFTITSPNIAPDITIFSPADEATSADHFMVLDVNVGDQEGNDMNISIFGSTSQSDFNTSLLYYLETSDNNVNIDYNWNAPVVQPDANTMALYHFDKRAVYNETATAVRDFAGKNHTATCPSAGNCPDFNAVGGKFAAAFYFDGGSPTASNDYFEIADSDDFDMIDWTIMGWFKMTGNGDTVSSGGGGVTVYPLVTKGVGEAEAANRDVSFFVGVQDSPVVLCADMEYDSNSGNDPVCGLTTIQTNQWYHFAAVFKSTDTPLGTFKIYLNGTLDGSGTIAGPSTQSSAQKVGIGTTFRQDTGASDGGFKGYIDEIAIIDKGLTATEIASYYRLDYSTYYWDVNASDADNNSTTATREFTLLGGASPDVNVAYPKNGESFDIVSVSTVDINVSLQDDDTNTFDMTLSLRYSTTQVDGSGTAIITDTNAATLDCDSNNLETAQECKYSWNISSVATGTYYILATASDGTNSDFNAGTGSFVITSSAVTPDANVLYPMSDENFNKEILSTIDINISIKDTDTNTFDLNIDINYSSSQTQGTGTVIIDDVNLATLDCDSNNLETAQECKYSWDISAMEAGKYYILTTVNDKYDSDFNAGANDFNIWCTGDWPYRMKLTFNNSVQTEDLNNFPVMVRLNSSRIDYDKVGRSNGGDIRFWDHDGNSIAYEIEDWNTAADSIIWVRVPVINSSSSTDHIFMDYGNECAPDGNQNAAVWANGYQAVYHFGETSGYYLDSTSNNNDANTDSIQVQARNNKDVNGFGYYPEFGGFTPADHIVVPDSSSLDAASADFTVMCRANAPTDATLADTDFMRKGSTGVAEGVWWKLEWGDAITTNSLHFNIHDGSGNDHMNYTKVPDAQWHDIWGTRDNTNTLGALWLDGSSVATDTSTRTTDLTNSANMGIGSKDTGDDDHYDGFLDECRVESTLRSANWIRAQHYSMDDNFISFSHLPDVNIWHVEENDFNAALPSFSYDSDGNLTVRFRVSDQDTDDLNFNMWYDTIAGGKANPIIEDLNLSTDAGHGACDTNTKTGMICTWDWNISGVSDNNYWITIEIHDTVDSNIVVSEKSFLVDNASPTTVDNDYDNSWQNADANIQFSCSADGSPCKNFYYSLDDTNYQKAWGTDQNIGISLTTDANHEIFYWSDDVLDHNESAHLIYLAVDKTAPTASISSPSSGSSQTTASVTLQYTGSDATSGIAAYYVKADSGSWINNSTSKSYSFTGQSTASHTYYVRAQDNADNNTDASVSITITSSTTITSGPTVGGYSGSPAYPAAQDQPGQTQTPAQEPSLELARADTQVPKGEAIDFSYTANNPTSQTIEVEVTYWIEKDGEKIIEGTDTILLEANEEKEIEAKLEAEEEIEGEYELIITLTYNGTTKTISQNIEIAETVPFNLDLHISRFPSKITEQPISLDFTIGSNQDKITAVKLKEVILKGNEIVWNNSQYIQVKASKKVARQFPLLEPGEYKWVITLSAGDTIKRINRTIKINPRPVSRQTMLAAMAGSITSQLPQELKPAAETAINALKELAKTPAGKWLLGPLENMLQAALNSLQGFAQTEQGKQVLGYASLLQNKFR